MLLSAYFTIHRLTKQKQQKQAMKEMLLLSKAVCDELRIYIALCSYSLIRGRFGKNLKSSTY